MTLAVLQASVLQTNGALSVAAGAQITVRTPAGALATLYEDRAGTTPTGANPIFADSKGFFRVYVAPGRYDVTVTTSSGTQVYKDIALFADGSVIGTAAAANLTTSATDTTAGRVLKVGDFGTNSTFAMIFVATTGNDSSGDGSSSNPFLTIGRAIDYINLRKDDQFRIIIVGSSEETPISFGGVNKIVSNKIISITADVTNSTYYISWNASLKINNCVLDFYGRVVGAINGCFLYMDTIRMLSAGSTGKIMFGGFYTSHIVFKQNDSNIVTSATNEASSIEIICGLRVSFLTDPGVTGCKIHHWSTARGIVYITKFPISTGLVISPDVDATDGVIWTDEIYHTGNLPDGGLIARQPAPAAVNTTATLTGANLQTRIITSTTAAAVTATLPTGTLMDGLYSALTNMAFDWSVINTGGNNFTVSAGTGHTVVGGMIVVGGSSGMFRSRRTGANTWVTYRVG